MTHFDPLKITSVRRHTSQSVDGEHCSHRTSYKCRPCLRREESQFVRNTSGRKKGHSPGCIRDNTEHPIGCSRPRWRSHEPYCVIRRRRLHANNHNDGDCTHPGHAQDPISGVSHVVVSERFDGVKSMAVRQYLSEPTPPSMRRHTELETKPSCY
jgi:hypothetical protein